jgi:hypothetical protein
MPCTYSTIYNALLAYIRTGRFLSPFLLLLYIDGERQWLNSLDNDISNPFP